MRTNVRGEPIGPFFKTITIRRAFANRELTETYDIGIIGGMVGGFAAGRAGQPATASRRTFGVTWIDKRLRLANRTDTTTEAGSERYTNHTELWWLERHDQLMVKISDESSDRRKSTVVLRYKRVAQEQ